VHVKIKEDTQRALAPLPPPLPPRQGRSAAFIRKRPDVSQCSPPRWSPPRSLLPRLQENRCPVSPYFGRPEVLEAECPCLPSLLTDIKARIRPLGPSNFKSAVPVAQSPVKATFTPPVKVDLKRGSFSSKQAMREAANVSIHVEVRASEAAEKRFSYRSPSPVGTTRTSRVQQLSKQFKLDKTSLQQSLSDMSRRTQSAFAQKNVTSPQDPKKRTLTPPPADLPWLKFVAALDNVTHITDLSVL